jgi:hypothetical protein
MYDTVQAIMMKLLYLWCERIEKAAFESLPTIGGLLAVSDEGLSQETRDHSVQV